MSSELYHIGVKGRSGRYKAGSGKNPKTGPRSIYLRAKKRKQEKTAAKVEKAVSSGSAKEVGKLKKYMSDDQLSKAVNRLSRRASLEKNIDSLSDNDVERGKALIDHAVTIGKVYGPQLVKWYGDKIEQQRQSEIASIVRSGDAKKILDANDRLSNNDVKDALTRIAQQKTLNKMVSESGSSSKDSSKSSSKSSKAGSKFSDFIKKEKKKKRKNKGQYQSAPDIKLYNPSYLISPPRKK